jgi:Flp pilus assembly protein TadG
MARACRYLAGWARNASGAAALEFALVVPVLLTAIFGIWFIGWAYNLGSEVGHAVELASRIYITNPAATASDLQTAVASHLTDVPIGDVTLATAQTTVGAATTQHITWSYHTSAPIPFISAVNFNFAGQVDVPLATAS